MTMSPRTQISPVSPCGRILAVVVHDLDPHQRVRSAPPTTGVVGADSPPDEVLVGPQDRDAGRRFGLAVAARHDRPEDLDGAS
jgi:hypothetical protein